MLLSLGRRPRVLNDGELICFASRVADMAGTHRVADHIVGYLAGTGVGYIFGVDGVGAGATGVVMQVLRAMTHPGDTIVMATPTFDGYPVCAQIAGLRSVTIPLDERGHHDLDTLAQAAARARIVVLCRPHNPTGTLESVAEVMRFLRRVPSDTIVLLDEAYIEFVAAAGRIDTGALITCFGNVVVVRTFSKAYGLAGLRIG
jgi:histidinol-phosphate aminotransferase